MATKTYGKEDIGIDQAVKNEPFIYEGVVQHEVHSKNAAILAHSIAVDTGVTRLYAKTQNGQTLEVIFDEPLMNGRHWVFVDSAYGATYHAQRNARVIRNGIRIQPVGVSGIGGVGVSMDFRKLILLDAYGRRFRAEGVPTSFELEEAWVDVLSLRK